MKRLVFTFILFPLLFTQAFSMEKNQNIDQTERKQRIEKAFNDLRADNLHILDSFYHPKLKFIDPIGELNGLDNMKAYYKKMYENVTEIKFLFSTMTAENNELTATWTMLLKAKGLNDGKEVKVEGVSHLKFDPDTNLVIYHRDYFDMGEFIYEYIPILGRIIKMVKGKLSHE
ncbi:MAG: nuclear transport factor 2 family protein [Halobacteriovoraceae bacterium]|nr:nuclear transport factor 2 family protein [Halobacteriovoraceae bacterium]